MRIGKTLVHLDCSLYRCGPNNYQSIILKRNEKFKHKIAHVFWGWEPKIQGGVSITALHGGLTEMGKIQRILFQITKGHHNFLLGQFNSMAIFHLILLWFLKHLTPDHTLLLKPWSLAPLTSLFSESPPTKGKSLCLLLVPLLLIHLPN